MKILFIGSKGFIGKHIVNFFSKTHDVWECDVVVDYTNPQYVQVDATNADYNDIFRQHQFDICINCSGAASVPDSIEHPQRDFMLNTVNVFKQLDAIRKYNQNCKYINLSSAAVYGNPEYLPIDEQHPLNPISPYGIHKKMAEDICSLFYHSFKVPTCSLRIFSAYGEGLYKQLFYDLSKKEHLNKTVSLYGTGTETRDFIYIQDLLIAIDLAMNHSNFENDKINIASGKETTIKEVAETFYKIFQEEIKVDFQGQVRKGDPLHWKADISKLKSLGFVPNYTLKNGLKNYVSWLKEKK